MNSPTEFDTNLFIEYSVFILKGPILFVLLDHVQVHFESLFFHQYLLIYFLQSCCQICQRFRPSLYVCVCVCVLDLCILVCFTFLSSFASLLCPSILISNPGFVFLFEFLRGIIILSLTSFAPVLINLFS